MVVLIPIATVVKIPVKIPMMTMTQSKIILMHAKPAILAGLLHWQTIMIPTDVKMQLRTLMMMMTACLTQLQTCAKPVTKDGHPGPAPIMTPMVVKMLLSKTWTMIMMVFSIQVTPVIKGSWAGLPRPSTTTIQTVVLIQILKMMTMITTEF